MKLTKEMKVNRNALLSTAYYADRDAVLISLMKIVSSGKDTFYASDVDLNGGQISALSGRAIILPTGNTKSVYVDFDDGYAKKVTAKEWKINENRRRDLSEYEEKMYKNRLDSVISELSEKLDVCKALRESLD